MNEKKYEIIYKSWKKLYLLTSAMQAMPSKEILNYLLSRDFKLFEISFEMFDEKLDETLDRRSFPN